MADVSVVVPFAKQQTLFHCGPATLEMLLSALGVARPAGPPTWQDQLWAAIEANTGSMRPSNAPSEPTSPPFPTQKCEWCVGRWKCWATTPGVLQHLANTYQGVANFAISTHGTEKSATTILLDTLDANLPAAALIRGWQHWIAVDGYRHSQTGSTPVGGRNLNGVYIRDPWETESVHYIKWADWKSDYLKFVPCGDYADTFVVMGGTRLAQPPPAPPPRPPTGLRIIDQLEIKTVRARLLKPLLPPLEAIQYARNAAAELKDAPRLRAGLDGAEAATAQLVQRLDDYDRYYYIVTLTSGGRDTARVIIDAHDGEYSEVSTIREKGQWLPPYVPAPASRSRLLSAAAAPTPSLRFQVREGAVGEHPIAVWKPCGQSSSPFLPFYQFSIGDSFVYYRFDGERFDELTEGPA